MSMNSKHICIIDDECNLWGWGLSGDHQIIGTNNINNPTRITVPATTASDTGLHGRNPTHGMA